VAEILGMKFSGIIAWWLWRGIYLEQTLPGFQKKVRGALDWKCWIWSSLKTSCNYQRLRSPTISRAEEASKPENT
jgi:hypothetical protein